VIADADGRIARAYNVGDLPYNVLIDRSGNIQNRVIGYSAGALEAAVKQLLGFS
jgi:hypothetical protein